MAGWPSRRVGAPDFLGHVGVPLRQALDVGFVNHGLVQGDVAAGVPLPVEAAVGDDALGHVRRRVGRVGLLGVREAVAEHVFRPT